MNDLAVIDRFTDVFSRYIDSGFGLLGGEVAFLTATLVVIDMTLAGLFWAMGGQDDVLGKLLKKTLYVGAFAYIINNFNWLAGVLFKSFAGMGLVASGNTITAAQLLQPGRLAQVGVETAAPLLERIGDLSGFTSIFANFETIVVLGLTWVVVVLSFFVLAVQLFITLIEFKLTTLAGFVMLPFALWNKTAFLAEKVLGNVIASGLKVLVLAVIVGISTLVFNDFRTGLSPEPTLDEAAAIMLASLAMLGLGIFGPGIATGLVSGAPQLGAGAAAGTALGVAGVAAAGVAAAGMAARGAGAGVRAGATMAGGARQAYSQAASASGQSGVGAAAAGLSGMARAGASAAGDGLRARLGRVAGSASSGTGGTSVAGGGGNAAGQPTSSGSQPGWAKQAQSRQRAAQGASMAAHAVRAGDGGGGAGPSPSLRDPSND